MDRLELLVRDVLVEHAADAPVSVARPGRPARRWLPPLVAAALVAALAVGAAVFAHSRSAERAQPSHFATPVGYKRIPYHGISVAVPSSLPIRFAYPCGIVPRSEVSVDYGLGYSGLCPGTTANPKPLRTPIVRLTRSQPGAEDGETFGTAARPFGVHVITGRRVIDGVLIATSAADRATVDTVLNSVRTEAVDATGCVSRLDSLDVSNPSADRVVPGEPTSAVECLYSTFQAKSGPYWLIRTVDRSVTSVLGLNSRPVADHAPSPSPNENSLILVKYRNGVRRLHVYLGGRAGADGSHAEIATDGQHYAIWQR